METRDDCSVQDSRRAADGRSDLRGEKKCAGELSTGDKRVYTLGCREPKRKFRLKELVAEFPQLSADTAGREVLESLHGHLKTYESAFCE